MLSDLDHVAVAVRSLEEALPAYRDLLEREPRLETVEEQGVRVAAFHLEDTRLELLEPLDEESPVASFLESRGEGLHHVAFRTDDTDRELRRADGAGLSCLDESGRTGAGGYRIGFLHPGDLHGALVELAQPPSGRPDEGRDRAPEEGA